MRNGEPLILIVEDDTPVRNLMVAALKTRNYKYETAQNAEQALLCATSRRPDVILMDLGLPDMDGVEVIRSIRTWSVTPIIVISARTDEQDKIEALDAGADDYLTKPFSVDELLARLRSTLRRAQYIENYAGEEQAVFQNGALSIDYTSARVQVSGQEVHLMPMEYSILTLLAKNVGKVLTYQHILDQVWSNAMESDLASLRVYMTTLRKKIESGEHGQKLIQTHIGIGYRMVKLDEESGLLPG